MPRPEELELQKLGVPIIGDDMSPREAASEWLAYLYSDHVSDEGRAAFRSWLAETPENAASYQKMEQVWRDVTLLGATEAFDAIPQVGEKIADRKVSVRMVAGASLLAAGFAIAASLLAIFTLQTSTEDVPVLQYATQIGDVETFGLADGSTLTLDTNSRVEVAFEQDARAIAFEQGRVFFDVKLDETAPFVVRTANGRITVVGTEFTISDTADGIDLIVSEGRVQAHGTQSTRDPLILSAGEAVLILNTGVLSEKRDVEVDTSLMWLTGRLSFIDEPLETVVQALNRYRQTPILIGDPSLKELRVTLSVQLGDTDQLFRGLEFAYPVEARQTENSVSLWSRRDAPGPD